MNKHRNHPHVEKLIKKKGLHRDWRTWVVIGIMLGAISIYVFTLDDSVEINAVQQIQTPAAKSTPNP